MSKVDDVKSALKEVKYPGFEKDIVTLGTVTTIIPDDDNGVKIDLAKVSAKPEILVAMEKAIIGVVHKRTGLTAEVTMAGAPISESVEGDSCSSGDGQQKDPFVQDQLEGVQNIVPVISGKGGVGKSTVSVNLAYALAGLGHKTGLLDLDIFGPSVHKMLGADKQKLAVDGEMILPHEAHGIKIVSIGMAVDEDDALILRGPMVMKLLNQLLTQVKWGELDYLIVDMPPGTGDVPLSLVQQLDVTGAVIVTTPQDISLIDVRRAISMFNKTETRMLGLVENMSYYKCENCGDIAHIFGSGGGKNEAARSGLPLLGQIPLTKSICEEAETGNPVFSKDKNREIAEIFEGLANSVIAAISAIAPAETK